MNPATLPEHIQRNLCVDEPGCWTWMRSVQQGYGATTVRGQRWLVHRFSYTHFYGPIPDGMVLDHLCRNRRCANPDHLEPVTIAENIKRGLRATQTHCKRGHEFTPENTHYWRETSEGGKSRKCLACRRELWREKSRAAGKKQRRSNYKESLNV